MILKRFMYSKMISLQHKIKPNMKRIAIFSLIIITLAACGSKNANNKNAKTAEVAAVKQINATEFKNLIMDYEQNPKTWIFKGKRPCVVDFYADWCRPCKMIAPIMEELAQEYQGKIDFYKVNTDKEPELSGVFEIQSIPAILFSPKQGQPAMQAGAMQKADYQKIIHEFLLGIKDSTNVTK
jgi:thioredoxin 1